MKDFGNKLDCPKDPKGWGGVPEEPHDRPYIQGLGHICSIFFVVFKKI